MKNKIQKYKKEKYKKNSSEDEDENVDKKCKKKHRQDNTKR